MGIGAEDRFGLGVMVLMEIAGYRSNDCEREKD